jgi:uncharacterized membrane protein (UPF0182 family)
LAPSATDTAPTPPPNPPDSCRPRYRSFRSRIAFSYYVDALWFGSLGYGAVFWKTQGVQWALFTAFASATFLVLYGSYLALKRAHRIELRSSQTILIGGQPVKLPVESVVRFIALGISLAIAIGTGAVMMADWLTLALYWHAPHATGSVMDPIFGKPLNFYLFTLPAWQLFAGWLMTLAVITCAVAVFFIVITRGARALAGHRDNYIPLPLRGLSITFAFLLLTVAMRVYLGRFQQLLDDHTIFAGVTYTDAHVWIPGMLAVCAGLVLGAVIAAANGARVGRVRWLVAAILPATACYLVISGIRMVRQQLYCQTE